MGALRACWSRRCLDFKFEAITSRDRMRHKDTYYIKVWREDEPLKFGLGEAALFRGLSPDDRPDYEAKLSEVCRNVESYVADMGRLDAWPSIKMGLETALSDLENGATHRPFVERFDPIKINGLIWMGDKALMLDRLARKLDEGFGCIKIKIGGIDEQEEYDMLRLLRREAPGVELRLDANGAFKPSEALERLKRLSEFDIHSIEQPIARGQWPEMAALCEVSPIPIALDEELIGVVGDEGCRMLDAITPDYIILKPTLCGGFSGAQVWIEEAEKRGTGWWVTSALESNVGLNAIARFVASHRTSLPQGLGTGELYYNNIPSPLVREGEWLCADESKGWELPDFEWN